MSDESATVDGELDLIVARLRDELTRSGVPSTQAGEVDQDGFMRRRGEAEDLWAVRAERPFLFRPGPWGRVRGLLLRPLKTTLRKLMRWYVEPFAADQRRYNAAVLKLVDALSERVDHLVKRELQELRVEVRLRLEELAEPARLVAELDERLTRLERRTRVSPSPPVVPSSGTTTMEPEPQETLPNYFAFESRMRGSVEDIRDRQRPYVPDFQNKAPVLDIGCGRGEFLVLLKEAGVEARGVDLDADMVDFCRGEGLEVEHGDALSYLESMQDGTLGGIFAAHVVEHLTTSNLSRLLELTARKLHSGGILVMETPNPITLIALSTFYADLTHVRPLHPKTLAFLAKHAGFSRVEVRFLNEPPAAGQLQPVPLPETPALEAARTTLQRNIDRLNEVVFGPQDYAVVART
jgi:SAM-dependent methyltransferase